MITRIDQTRKNNISIVVDTGNGSTERFRLNKMRREIQLRKKIEVKPPTSHRKLKKFGAKASKIHRSIMIYLHGSWGDFLSISNKPGPYTVTF